MNQCAILRQVRSTLPLVLVCATLAACGSPPRPDMPTLPAVGLAGQRVVVFPVQRALVPGEPDRELSYAVEARAGTSRWVLPEALEASIARSPGVDVPVRDLPVDIFFRAEVDRIGDPLYGMIRRAASLSDARTALIPLSVSWRAPVVDETGATIPGAVEVYGALINVLTGEVIWSGVREGPAEGPDDPGGLPRAMDAFAAGFLPAG